MENGAVPSLVRVLTASVLILATAFQVTSPCQNLSTSSYKEVFKLHM